MKAISKMAFVQFHNMKLFVLCAVEMQLEYKRVHTQWEWPFVARCFILTSQYKVQDILHNASDFFNWGRVCKVRRSPREMTVPCHYILSFAVIQGNMSQGAF
jgi:hypothetical protein